MGPMAGIGGPVPATRMAGIPGPVGGGPLGPLGPLATSGFRPQTGSNMMMGGGGGAAPLGMAPPGTAMRMGTAAGQRPGSGMRQGTAAGRQGGPNPFAGPAGVGMATDVKVTDRPMTQQGVMGMKTGSMGPGRQIYDKSYWMIELRKKTTELTTEIQRFNKEVGEIQSDANTYASLEKRYDQLIRTVRNLEGDLADYNLALDKQRTDTRPEEVHHMYMILKGQNDQQRGELDQIFLEKKSHEEEVRKVEAEIEQIQKASEDRLNELHPDQREEYESGQQEAKRLNADIGTARGELDELNMRLQGAEGRLRSDMLRTRAQQLREIRKEMDGKRETLRGEAAQASLSIPEQRDMLLAKVKSDNLEIVAAEKRANELKSEIEKYKRQIQEMQTDIEERKGESNDQQKYEILYTKDQEMTAFIEGFAASQQQETEKIGEKQQRIVQLLESISKACAAQPNPQQQGEQMRDMQDELEFKSRQLQDSETTQQRLQAELEKRTGELEKINSLDAKISTELQGLENKIKQYQSDMTDKFDHVEELKREKEGQMRELEERKVTLEARAGVLTKQVGFLKLRYDGKKQQLLENETNTTMESSEQKIKQFEQNLFHLRSFISAKTAESDYQSHRSAAVEMAEQINTILQKQLHKQY